MDQLAVVTVSRLRSRASQCREMARGALSEAIAETLLSIADDYDRDALRLEGRGSMTDRWGRDDE